MYHTGSAVKVVRGHDTGGLPSYQSIPLPPHRWHRLMVTHDSNLHGSRAGPVFHAVCSAHRRLGETFSPASVKPVVVPNRQHGWVRQACLRTGIRRASGVYWQQVC